MTEMLFWGSVLRFSQAFLEASPFIVVGIVVAAIFRRLLGYENTRRLFGQNTWRSLPQAWLIGMLLPVDSLGVIPVIIEMRRAGVSGGTILAFALTAPLFNPLSLLYGLTLSEPFTIFAFAGCSFVVVTLIGFLWDRLFPQNEQPEPGPPEVDYGLKRMLALGVESARCSWGGLWLYLLAGFFGVVLLNLVLPPGTLQRTVNGDNPLAPLLMVAVAIPAYATPMLAMSQVGSMFSHGNSIGAAFVLLTLGTGLNLGLCAWMFKTYGWKPMLTWFALLLVIVISLAYAINDPLHPRDVEMADHTHAFDVYCCPFRQEQTALPETVWKKIKDDVQTYQLAGLLLFATLTLLGLSLRVWDPSRRVEAWLESRQPSPAETTVETVPWHNRPLPPWMLGAAALVILVGLSLVGCYTYYPPPQTVFDEMFMARGEALTAARSGQQDEAKYWIAILDDWTRKLQVGVYLREGNLNDYQRMKARLLRDQLEWLEHSVEDGHQEEVSELCALVSKSQARLRNAYLP